MKLFLVALALHAAPTTSDALRLRVRLHRTRDYAVSCADGTSEVSVIPWEEPGCAAGQLCIAARSDGACPEGASCSHVGVDASGNSVFGCVDTSILVGGVQAAASDDGGDVCDEEADETPMGVVGWEHNGCVTGDPAQDDQDRPSPSSAKMKLLLTVASLGVAVTAPSAAATSLRVRVHTASTTTCGDGEQTIGVAGWDHDGCVATGYVCVADVSDGDCPDGAHCDLLDTGVYGCMDGAPEDYSYYGSGEVDDGTCGDGEQTIGVAGWDHDGCIDSDYVCVADVSDGDCPEGAYCALLDTGVYGCTAGDAPTEDYSYYGSGEVDDGTCGDGEQTIGVVGWDHDGCIDSDYVCVAAVSDGDCPAGAYCDLLDTGVYGCVSSSHKKHHKKHHHHKSTTTCPSGQQTIGVEGWSQDGCVATGNVCVADVDGDCPTGAHCDVLDTGVYGCMDGAPPTESTSWTGCSGSEQTIGVVGWDHDGCIDSDYVCVAAVSDGDCPAGAYCDLLDTGVYGCVSSSHKKHHKKVHHHHHKSQN
ncbi:hypothetical protein BBJ28_00023606 [Nothophytophthora sp. Chile5]|nr:hypothetical protein BBJ28_00023606 [Nothophytophthora sp. Chile5]